METFHNSMPAGHRGRTARPARPSRLLAALLLGALLAVGLRAPLSPALAGPPPAAPKSADGTYMVGLFPDQTQKTNSVQVVVDGDGGIHMAYAPYSSATDSAHYAYCAAHCDTPSHWSIVTLSDGSSTGQEVQIALTPAGQPRLLIRGEDEQFRLQYQYAECNSSCTDPASWALVTLGVVTYIDLMLFDYSQHYFALDHQGRPRFVYHDNNGALNHRGTYYAYCNSGCTTATNWSEYRLLDEDDMAELPSLVFDALDRPRLAAVINSASNPTASLAYLECNANCESGSAVWNGVYLAERGSGHVSWVLRLDMHDRPRLAFYQGSLDTGAGNTLYYLWCNAACTDFSNWGGAPVPLTEPAAGDPQVDLQLHEVWPRLSYQTGSPSFGVGIAFCSANCESASGTWTSFVRETSTELNAAWPRPPYPGCTFSSWYGGYRSSLALSPAGDYVIAYDAEHLTNSGASCTSVTTDYHTVRLLVPASTGTPPPPPGGERKLWLPIAMK